MFRSVIIIILFFVSISAISAPVKITVLSDLHVSPGNIAETSLRETVREINRSDADLVVVTGDLTNRGATAELETVKKILDLLNKPYYAIPGNHETNWSDNGAQTFPRLFGGDRFAFRQGGAVLIGLSTGPYLKMGDGHVRAEDLTFLKDSLARLADDGAPVLLFLHYPLASELSNAAEITRALTAFRVAAVVSGHTHSLVRREIYGYDSIICRPLVGRDRSTGYVELEFKDGRVEAKEKRLGDPVRKAVPSGSPIPVPPPEPTVPTPGVVIEPIRRDPASVFSSAAFDGERLFYTTSDGRLVAVSALDGSRLWERKLASALYSTPAIAKGVVLTGSIDNRLVGVGAADGALRWEIPTVAPVTGSGRAAGGNFFCGGGAREFFRIEPESGRVLWKSAPATGTFQAPPAVSEELIATGAWDTRLYAISARDGKTLWSWSNGKSQPLFSPGNVVPVITDTQVVIVAPDRFMTALDRKNGKQLWRDHSLRFRESLGRSADGKRIYAKTMDGELVAVAADRPGFTLLWKCDLGIGYDHAPCPILESAGIVYAGSRRGVIAAVRAADGKLLWNFRAGSSAVNGFTDGGTCVYFTLIEGVIGRIRAGQR